MKNIPEINPCIPNPEARWCPDCRAHTGFYLLDTDSQFFHACRKCEKEMFRFVRTEFEANLSCGYTVGFSFIGLLLWQLGGWAPFWGSIFYFIAFLNAMKWWARSSRSRSWVRWRAIQKGKTESELEQEGLEHPFQTECEPAEDFYEWASQFFDSNSEEWKEFKARYEQGEEPVEEKSEEADFPAEVPPSPPPLPPSVDMLED
jgi:hypothetical protein